MIEELKAQTGALFLLEFLRSKKLITDELAQQSFTDAIVWAFGHISQGMYTGDGKPQGVRQARRDPDRLPDRQGRADVGRRTRRRRTARTRARSRSTSTSSRRVADELMKDVAGIKARGDKAAAEKLIARYVDSEHGGAAQADRGAVPAVPEGELRLLRRL